MVETMRMEGHKALVHTAAASNLGQMLNRICIADGIGLVNIVRKPEQEKLLRDLGARHVCNATSPTFLDELTEALVATGATIAFDAIGGGRLAGQILSCMEAAVNRTAKEYSRYGSAVHKQVYIYGGLDMAPTEFVRNFGMAWGMGGWLLFPFLQKIGPAAGQKLRARVAAELKTTFAATTRARSRSPRRCDRTWSRLQPARDRREVPARAEPRPVLNGTSHVVHAVDRRTGRPAPRAHRGRGAPSL
jgi:NADPH2:quinone reductase